MIGLIPKRLKFRLFLGLALSASLVVVTGCAPKRNSDVRPKSNALEDSPPSGDQQPSESQNKPNASSYEEATETR
ncbi:MAG: hypothetical protein KDD22_06685, partial [Bdellovibrionales bacterium]|nr:hypothetical protein [Bdellovibrionales bacterium]